VRGDAASRLTAPGWAALEAHGVRTIVDLRNDDEIAGGDTAPRPPGLATVRVPLDGVEHTDFWDEWATGPQFGTPLLYAMLGVFGSLDVDAYFRAAGLAESDLNAIRARLAG
jgi:hypothetical protein